MSRRDKRKTTQANFCCFNHWPLPQDPAQSCTICRAAPHVGSFTLAAMCRDGSTKPAFTMTCLECRKNACLYAAYRRHPPYAIKAHVLIIACGPPETVPLCRLCRSATATARATIIAPELIYDNSFDCCEPCRWRLAEAYSGRSQWPSLAKQLSRPAVVEVPLPAMNRKEWPFPAAEAS